MWRIHSESYLEAFDWNLCESKNLVFSMLGGSVEKAEVGRNPHHSLAVSPWAGYLASLSLFFICNVIPNLLVYFDN